MKERKKIIAIHQPTFMPWLGFFDKMFCADEFVILDHAQFVKDQYDNRVRIKTPRGAQWCSVPVKKKGRSIQSFREVEIDRSTCWNTRIYRILAEAYKNSPYFAPYWQDIGGVLLQEWDRLFDLNLAIIHLFRDLLSISTRLSFSSSLGVQDTRGSALNALIVETLQGRIYYSGEMGKKYLRAEDFQRPNISVVYQDNLFSPYRQAGTHFSPGLSIIDMLFNCGADAILVELQKKRALFYKKIGGIDG